MDERHVTEADIEAVLSRPSQTRRSHADPSTNRVTGRGEGGKRRIVVFVARGSRPPRIVSVVVE